MARKKQKEREMKRERESEEYVRKRLKKNEEERKRLEENKVQIVEAFKERQRSMDAVVKERERKIVKVIFSK